MTDPLINHDIFKDNPYEPEFAITKKAAGTGALTPANGIAGSTIHLSATKGGPTIHAALVLPAVERAAKPGYYYPSPAYTIALINTYIFPAFDRKAVHVVWGHPVNGLVNDEVRAYSVRDAG